MNMVKKTLGQLPVGSSNLYIVWILMSAMSALTKSMCWKMVNKTNDTFNQVGLAIFRKPSDNKCYEKRMENNPPLCEESDDPDAAWYADSLQNNIYISLVVLFCYHVLYFDA